jgi:hypothetical protein
LRMLRYSRFEADNGGRMPKSAYGSTTSNIGTAIRCSMT